MSGSVVVFQSAPKVHAAWVDRCMSSVARWAAVHGADYLELADPDFLGLVPDWVVAKCEQWINPVTDLARLLAARELLGEYDAAVWVDADVFIWAPDHFSLPITRKAVFARERWMERWPDGRLRFLDNVSNFVCSFAAGAAFLQRHIADVEAVIRQAVPPLKLGVAGTSLLTRQYDRSAVELIGDVANFSPVLLEAIGIGREDDVKAFEAGLSSPLVAANLCLSHESRSFQGRTPRPGALPRLVTVLASKKKPLWPSELIGSI
jgi:hypothetical protein